MTRFHQPKWTNEINWCRFKVCIAFESLSPCSESSRLKKRVKKKKNDLNEHYSI